MTYVNYMQYKIQYNEKCNSAIRVAGLAVCIIWRYSTASASRTDRAHVWMLRPTHAKYKAIYCIRWSLGGSTRVLYQTSVRIVNSLVGSIVRIVASIRMQVLKSPLARGVKN